MWIIYGRRDQVQLDQLSGLRGFLAGSLEFGSFLGGVVRGWEGRRGVGVFGIEGCGTDVEQGGGALGGVTHGCMWLGCGGEGCGSGDGGCGVGGAGMGMLWRSERGARSMSHLRK